MANLLFAWELGGGLGHVTVLQPLVDELARRGHRVTVALRHVTASACLFKNSAVRCVQSPVAKVSRQRFLNPCTFVQLIQNIHFDDARELAALAGAWSSLFELVGPDVIVFDHSPTALLAARCHCARRVLIGTGFCCPPACVEFPDWRPWLGNDPADLQKQEANVLASVDLVLTQNGSAPMRKLSDLYTDVDEALLTTFRELDHYPKREGATYWGVFPSVGGTAPQWPPGDGKRLFAYLKPSPALPALLNMLAETEFRTTIFGPQIDERLRSRFTTGRLRFETQPLDIVQVSAECDLAMLHAGHGSVASLLLAGKPMLLLPRQLEQHVTTMNVVRLGAGLAADIHKASLVRSRLLNLAQDERYAAAARRFSESYADHDAERQCNRAADRIEELACG